MESIKANSFIQVPGKYFPSLNAGKIRPENSSGIRQLMSRLLLGKKYFSDRIKHRHKMFWNSAESELVRNTVMYAQDPIDKWEGVEYWQRKLSNKHNARQFAIKHGCRVPDLYWKGRDCTTINFNSLPDYYVIKPTIGHSANLVFLMNNGINLFDNHAYTPAEIRKIMKKAINVNPGQEFLIEEFNRTEKGEYKIPDDYKLMCFNGEIACICVVNRLSPKVGFHSFYTENWERMDEVNTLYAEAAYQEPPKCLQEMLYGAKALSKSYKIFVRVDFYATSKGAVFGEFTPTPCLGTGFTPYAEKLFTNYWDTYCSKMI